MPSSDLKTFKKYIIETDDSKQKQTEAGLVYWRLAASPMQETTRTLVPKPFPPSSLRIQTDDFGGLLT
jgi:hypothetical protein